MTRKNVFVRMFAVCACLLIARPARATSILVNGDFETGDLSGWALRLACESCHGVFVSSKTPYEGNYEVVFQGPSIGAGFQDQLSQRVSTQPGESYLLDFWMMQDSPPCSTTGDTRDRFYCTFNNFSILWNGERAMFRQVIPPGGYLEYQAVLLAVDPVSVLTIDGANDAGYSRFDNITLTPLTNNSTVPPFPLPTPVPEPATVALMAIGLACVVTIPRRRRSRALSTCRSTD
jgi:hypothetical protein